MIRINLLSWREQRRNERKQQFQRQLGLVAVFALSVVLAIFIKNAQQTAAQDARNQLLGDENAKLDHYIREVQQLEQQIAALNMRRMAVEQLQLGRTYPVRLLADLAQRVPQGVALRSVKQSGSITLSGVAQSNTRISEFLQALESSAEWLGQPELGEIKSASLGQGRDVKKIVEFSIRLEPQAHDQKQK